MEEFLIYLKLGFKHITDLAGYDHMLFIVAITCVYTIHNWKNIIGVVTFFTIGHSITLALAVLNIVTIDSNLIEFLIPVTIFLTCISNIFYKNKWSIKSKLEWPKYFLTLFFGLIHGLGFSNYLRGLMGQNFSIVKQLFAFNLGLEIGQLVIVAIFLTISYILIFIMKVRQSTLNYVISSFVAGITVTLIINKWIF